MTKTQYLPGDRVQWSDPNVAEIRKGDTGTVVESIDKAYPFSVHFDRDELNHCDFPGGNRHWWDDRYFTRQPIQPGCWVRTTWSHHINHTGEVVKIAFNHRAYVRVDGFSEIEQVLRLADLARIATPAAATEDDPRLWNDPIKWAENLIRQLPETHEARNSWLMNHSPRGDAQQMREKHPSKPVFVDLSGVVAPPNDVDRLAEWIKANIPERWANAPDQAEKTGDVAIRLLSQYRRAIDDAANILGHDSVGQMTVNEWLKFNAPDKLKPVFKRGDLVTWAAGQIYGRITKLPGENNDMWEVMTTGWNDGCPYNGKAGSFTNLTIDQGMRHVNAK